MHENRADSSQVQVLGADAKNTQHLGD